MKITFYDELILKIKQIIKITYSLIRTGYDSTFFIKFQKLKETIYHIFVTSILTIDSHELNQ